MKAVHGTRRRDSAGIHELILAAAREVLAEEGEQGFNLAQVARRAGVDRGTPYAHFQTCEQLIGAVVAEMSDELCQQVFSGTPTIDSMICRFAHFIAEHPEFGDVWLLRLFKSKRPAKDRFSRLYLAHFEEFVKSEYAQPHIDAEVLAVTILAGTLVWPMWVRACANDREGRRNMAQRFASEISRISFSRRATATCNRRAENIGSPHGTHYAQSIRRTHCTDRTVRSSAMLLTSASDEKFTRRWGLNRQRRSHSEWSDQL